MDTIQTVIIDDEEPARERINYLLKDFEKIVIVGEAEDGEKGLEVISKKKPGLVFLDIQMPVKDGFQLLSECSYRPAVVFVSAYDEYALKAFDVSAVDYLLKPYTKERFIQSVKKVVGSIDNSSLWDDKISSLLRYYEKKQEILDFITIKKGLIYKIYETENIDFFRMDGGILFLFSNGEKLNMEGTLSSLENKLDSKNFFRVHRNSIVNLKKIKKIVPWGQGRIALNFGESGSVHVSRDKVKLLKYRIGLKF